jgi:riboflavin biosynthesis pyrimidine reductase
VVQAEPTRAAALRRAGALLVEVPGSGLRAALECLPALDVHSIEIEGGAAIHAAAWEEGVVDAVQLYVAPVWLGPEGVPLFCGRGPDLMMLEDRRVEILGPDVLIEGDVQRPG